MGSLKKERMRENWKYILYGNDAVWIMVCYMDNKTMLYVCWSVIIS